MRAQVLRPRGIPIHLALTVGSVVAFRPLPTTSASRSFRVFAVPFSWPAFPPVNASTPLLRGTSHDSGPVWFASLALYDSFIHYIPPVLTGARQRPVRQHRASP